MSECNLQPGWLLKQLKENAVSVATFPKFMRESFADSILTAEERKEAARRLRERADELDPKEPAQPPAPTWEPMETAPRNGTEILAWREDAGVFIAHFVLSADGESEDWFTTAGEHLPGDERPTYWMPLPDEPAAALLSRIPEGE